MNGIVKHEGQEMTRSVSLRPQRQYSLCDEGLSIFSFIGYVLTELFGKTDNWLQIYQKGEFFGITC